MCWARFSSRKWSCFWGCFGNGLTLGCRTFQILFYALRPTFVRVQRFTKWHVLNIIAQVIFDYFLVSNLGSRPLVYLIMSSFFAGSLHPCAGHFIAEHYLWDGTEQETYSYYGPLNLLAYNVRSRQPHLAFFLPRPFFLTRSDTTMNTTTSRPSHGLAFQHFVSLHRNSTTTFHLIRHGQ